MSVMHIKEETDDDLYTSVEVPTEEKKSKRRPQPRNYDMVYALEKAGFKVSKRREKE